MSRLIARSGHFLKVVFYNLKFMDVKMAVEVSRRRPDDRITPGLPYFQYIVISIYPLLI